MLAATILGVHVAVIAFNLFGLVAIPLGGWLRWRFVHAPVWRLAHIVSLAIVAVQASLGRACFLTVWQDEASGGAGTPTPLIMRLVNGIVYWPLPIWVFGLIYAAIFTYVVALVWIVPIRRIRSGR